MNCFQIHTEDFNCTLGTFNICNTGSGIITVTLPTISDLGYTGIVGYTGIITIIDDIETVIQTGITGLIEPVACSSITTFLNNDINNVVVNASGSDTINTSGISTYVIQPQISKAVIHDGVSRWYVI